MIVSGLYFNHITFLLLLLYTNQPRRDIDLAGQAAYGRRGKEIFDTDLYLQLAVDTFQDRHGFKRIPPQLKEIIVDTDTLVTKEGLP